MADLSEQSALLHAQRIDEVARRNAPSKHSNSLRMVPASARIASMDLNDTAEQPALDPVATDPAASSAPRPAAAADPAKQPPAKPVVTDEARIRTMMELASMSSVRRNLTPMDRVRLRRATCSSDWERTLHENPHSSLFGGSFMGFVLGVLVGYLVFHARVHESLFRSSSATPRASSSSSSRFFSRISDRLLKYA